MEYAFVRDVMPLAEQAFPLAGNAEKAFGDLVTKSCEGFRLIEFKARRSDIWSEKKKFPSFQSEGVDFEPKFHALLAHFHPKIVEHGGANGHWLVYGVATQGRSGFLLECQPYSGNRAGTVPLRLQNEASLKTVPTVTYEVLSDYLALLEQARGSATGVDSSGGLMIIGVSGGRTIALTEQEFRRSYPSPSAQQEREFDLALPVATPSRAHRPGSSHP